MWEFETGISCPLRTRIPMPSAQVASAQWPVPNGQCPMTKAWSTHLDAVAIRTVLVHVAAEGVGIEAVLEGVQDVAAAGPLRSRNDEEYDGHQEDDDGGEDNDDHTDEVRIVRLLIDGAWRNYCNGSGKEQRAN